VLEDDYYLANFRSLIDFVNETYQGILSDAELRWHRSVSTIPEPAQRLYVRLSARRSAVFRISKITYPEIDSIGAAAQALAANGLGATEAPCELCALLPTFTKPELIKLLGLSELRRLSRADLDQFILDKDSPADVAELQRADRWITIQGLDEYTVFKLCFFGNCYQDMTEFVLTDLGVLKYEPYRINKHSRVFQTRAQLEAHLQYFACSTLLDEIDQTDVDALLGVSHALPEKNSDDPHLTRRVDRLLNTIARQLERLNELPRALSLYRQSQNPPSRERQVRVLIKLSMFEDALQVCKEIELCPLAEAEQQFVNTISPKLHKQLSISVPKSNVFRPLT